MSLIFAAAARKVMDERVCAELGVAPGSTCVALQDGPDGLSLSLSSNSAALIFRALGLAPAVCWEGGEVDAREAALKFEDAMAGPGAMLLDSYDYSVLSEAWEIAQLGHERGFPLFAWA